MVFIFEKKVKTKNKTYTYLCLGHTKRVNGKSKRVWEVILCRKDKIEENLDIIKRKLSRNLPEPEEYEFGLVYALYSISEMLDLAGIINSCVKKRNQGVSVGEYITLLAINRAVSLNSKSKVSNWFNKTALYRYFPGISDFLSVQNILNGMGYLNEETINRIEELLCKKLYSDFGLRSDCFLFDPSNFFTYIKDRKNTIAQRGYNKKKRNDLRQISVSLMVTREECNIPLMHESYEGNISDVVHFKNILERIERRFKLIGLELPEITLVFDKGNNSNEAFRFLDSKGIHFVSSIRPSLKASKPILEVPLSDYEELWTKKNGNKVYGYRTTTTAYLGKPNTLISVFDEDSRELQKHRFDEKLNSVILKLNNFIESKLNSKPQWRDAEKVISKIRRDILNTRQLRSLINITITNGDKGLKLEWEINDEIYRKLINNFGKSLIFSNRNEWSSETIAKTYRAQIKIERQFKELNKRNRISIMPMYVRTDLTVRAHVFISILALLLSNLLLRKLRASGIRESKDSCFDALENIKEIHLHYNDKDPPDIVLTRMSPFQRKLFNILGLKRFLPK